MGDEATEAAWLIAQHSPDRTFMAKCPELVRRAVEAGGSVGAQSRVPRKSRTDDPW